ncbi:hypothetical protein [uncultured Roseobacter sp.]|uniref:hypothetical protein n=1 Tax=uncultured Roseobacter sp. TaxID=114847 RepID=UPI00262E9BF6|nr:hypothetical protein [uncultured Roseobacter sp.]
MDKKKLLSNKNGTEDKSGIDPPDKQKLGFLSNIWVLISTVTLVSLVTAALRFFAERSPNGSSAIEQFFLGFFEPIAIGISVSFIFFYVQNKLKADELSKHFSRYENVFAAAELLQSSRENNGLAGIVPSPEEENIFEEFSRRSYQPGTAPTIWWMNFRIEKYDTFKDSIERFVKQGGHVHVVTTHHRNPNINFRREEAYPEKSVRDYEQHFRMQARTFIKLENSLRSIEDRSAGKFRVYFNEGTPAIPIFIVKDDLDYRAYTGYYLNEISGKLPYVYWETAAEGMVGKLRDYVEFKMSTCVSASEMEKDPDIVQAEAEIESQGTL